MQLRGTPLRVVSTRANTQPAFGCYLPDMQAAVARAYALVVLTLEGDWLPLSLPGRALA